LEILQDINKRPRAYKYPAESNSPKKIDKQAKIKASLFVINGIIEMQKGRFFSTSITGVPFTRFDG